MKANRRLAAVSLAVVVAAPTLQAQREETAVFAGGCFWGVQWVYEHVAGIKSVVSGYAGGTLKNPTYRQVGAGTTGHAETVRIVFDPSVVSYRQLLEIFFLVAHDPTSLDRQGPDVGSDYRAIVFAQDTAQRQQVTEYVAALTARKVFGKPIVTEIRGAQPFYDAEEYHQRYAERHPNDPYILINDVPKLKQLQKLFPALYRP